MIEAQTRIRAGVPSLKAAYAEESIYVGADKLDELAALKSKDATRRR